MSDTRRWPRLLTTLLWLSLLGCGGSTGEADADSSPPEDATFSVPDAVPEDALGPDADGAGDTSGPDSGDADVSAPDVSDAPQSAEDVADAGDTGGHFDAMDGDVSQLDVPDDGGGTVPPLDGGADVSDADAVEPTPLVLIITELMRDPAAGEGQWVEVMNPSLTTASLADCQLATPEGAVTSLPALTIAPQGLIVVAAPGATGLEGVDVAGTWDTGFSLSATATALQLQDALGDVVDAVPFGEGFPVATGRSVAVDGGLEFDDASVNDAAESWCLALVPYGLGDLGSPGEMNPACTLPACGDGEQQSGESCDDGNAIPGDGCELTCVPTPSCGNGLLEEGEFCDDGNSDSCDGCTLCQLDLDSDTDGALDCGDNCPDTYNPTQGDVDGDGLGDLCDFQDCGNLLTEGSETCDDGNLISGDGCSAGCLEEDYGAGAVVINELMLRPDAVGAVAENRLWVEFFNPGAQPVDLAGMTFQDDFGQVVTLPPATPVVIPAGGYGVIATHADPVVNGGVTSLVGTLAGFVPKAGFGQLEVRWQGVLVDRVGWDPGVLFPDGYGMSLGLSPGVLAGDDPATANNEGDVWCYGTLAYGPGGLGSPALPNPVCPDSYCGDGILQAEELCDDFNTQDGDGCDLDCTESEDSDSDGVFDGVDNCVGDFNPSQSDQDLDGIGDTCDVQECGNTVVEGDEACDDGNVFAGDGCSPLCGVESYGVGTLVITEVMAEPVGVTSSAGRWIEVYNTTTEPVGLGGLRLTDASGGEGLVNPEATAVVAPGHVAVIGVNPTYEDNGGLPVHAVADLLPLDDGVLTLWWQDVPFDSIAFEGGWPAPTGVAWTLSGLAISASANDDLAYWCPALTAYGLVGNLGSPGSINDACVTVSCGDGAPQPGEQCDDGNTIEGDGCEPDCTVSVDSDDDGAFDAADNCPFVSNEEQVDSDGDGIGDPCDTSLCGNDEIEPGETCDDGDQLPGDGCNGACQVEVFLPGDVIISEIMADPSTLVDADGQWFELANLTPVDIDIRGWVIGDGLFDTHIVSASEPVVVPTKGVLVLGLNADPSVNGGVALDYVVDDFLLAHGPDEIELSWNGVRIDRVPLAKEGGPTAAQGRSLALNPAAWVPGAGALSSNWCAQQSLMPGGDRGSPGEENDPCVPGILCGDGVLLASLEACDDGADNSDTVADACRLDCTQAGCGDGVQDAGEACDDGNAVDGDGCQATCQVSSLCGNGTLDADEDCDDGGLNSDTAPGACRLDCVTASCGDGVWDPDEGCDDGNTESGDACTASCQPPANCGNGVIDAGEVCDDGPANSDEIAGACRTDCGAARCGDGVVDPDEACDDGNFDPADGCEATCTPSPDADTDGVPDAVDLCPDVADIDQQDADGDGLGDACDPPICGNGAQEGDEVCDDGNPFSGDGCSPTCLLSLALPGDLVITEIMQNPHAAQDGDGEWFEVYNASAATLDLAGWRITDEAEDEFVVQASLPLAPGAWVVFGRSSDLAVNGGVDVDLAYGAAILMQNGADALAVYPPQGDVVFEEPIDRVAWDGGPEWPDPTGASMALEPNLTDAEVNDEGAIWCPSTEPFGAGDLGTPGAPNGGCVVAACGNGYVEPGEACDDGEGNGFDPGACRSDCTEPVCGDGIVDPDEACDDGNLTTGDGCEVTCLTTDPDAVCGDDEVTGLEFCDDGNTLDGDGCSAACLIESVQAGDVLITEIMVQPEGLDPSDGQWFEVLNMTSAPINLNGWRVRDGVLEDSAIQVGQPLFLQPGERGVLVRNANPAANGGIVASLAVVGGIHFAPQEDAIELVWNGQLIDRVAWDAVWGVESGRALSLDPLGEDLLQNDLTGVWCSALSLYDGLQVNYGTPGAENPSCPEIAICGDGVVELEEECDDANLLYGDGCSAACQDESVVSGGIILTELAARSAAATGNGSWLEFYVVESASLGGWKVQVGGETYQLPNDVALHRKSGEHLVIAGSGDVLLNGGVVPDVVLPGLDLQLGLVAIALVNQGVVVDEVVPAANWLFASGYSLALDPGAHDSVSNDAPEAWCPAITLYGDGDFGSPGEPNLLCPPPVICGNGVSEGDEACDDGNFLAGDGCEPDCTLTPVAGCGNGVLDPGEACDDGGLASGDGCSLSCELEAFSSGDVVITEIMQNPSAVTDGLGEWFEVHNPGPSTVDLAGWYLTDLGTNAHQIDPKTPLPIPPGGYAVLGIHPDPAVNGGADVDYAYATFSLSNGADAIQLTWNGVLIDVVAYDGGTLFPDPIGASMVLDPDANNATWNDDGGLWCVSQTVFGAGDQGTPGSPNDQCSASAVCGNGVQEGDEVCDDGNDVIGDGCDPDCTDGPLYVCGNEILEGDEGCDDGNVESGDGCNAMCFLEDYAVGAVVFTELMINPAAVDDFNGEWVELLNTADVAIDLAGWSIGDGASELYVFDSAVPFVVSPGERVVIGRDADLLANGGVNLDLAIPQMSLKNLADTLLLTWGDLVIDAVGWDQGEGWIVPEGASLTLAVGAEDAVSNDLRPSWCAATQAYGDGDLGTPGDFESNCLPPIPVAGEVVLTELRRAGPPTAPEYEFFEVYNLAPHTVRLDGLVIEADGAGQATLQGGVVLAGDFAWAAPNLPASELGGSLPDATYESFQLPDGAATLTLRRGDGEVLDVLPVTDTFPGLSFQAMSADPVAWHPADNDTDDLWCVAPASPGSFGGCGLTDHLTVGSLVITEVRSGDDWAVEVTNLVGDSLPLLGLRVVVEPADGAAVSALVLDETPVSSGGQVVLNSALGGGLSGVAIDEEGTVLRLEAVDGVVVDQVALDASFPWPAEGSIALAPGALSAEANDDPTSWCQSPVEAESLGSPNTVCLAIPPPGTLVITEIMARSAQAISTISGGWVEVANLGDEALDLGGLVLRDDGGDFWPIPAGTFVEAGGYLVFGATGNTQINGGAPVDVKWSLFSLDPIADEVVLEVAGSVVDAVAYDQVDGWPLLDGHSMSLSEDAIDTIQNDSPGAWCAGTSSYGDGDLGTPGGPNDPCVLLVGSVILAELMPDPINMADSDGEYVELYNAGPTAQDLSGWRLEGSDGDSAVLPTPLAIGAGERLLLTRSADISQGNNVVSDAVYEGLTLSNAEDDVRLVHPTGLVIDTVAYDATWLIVPGRSLELLDSSLDHESNDESSAWCASASPVYGLGNQGTPGDPIGPCD